MYGDQFGEFVCGYWHLKGFNFTNNFKSAFCRWNLKYLHYFLVIGKITSHFVTLGLKIVIIYYYYYYYLANTVEPYQYDPPPTCLGREAENWI